MKIPIHHKKMHQTKVERKTAKNSFKQHEKFYFCLYVFQFQ
jgi:hypothetical protein